MYSNPVLFDNPCTYTYGRPFIYRVTNLHKQLGISTIVVIGGCGDWFDVHDTVLLLDDYKCLDATKRAHSISKMYCNGRVEYNGRGLVHRLPWPKDILPRSPDIRTIQQSLLEQPASHSSIEVAASFDGSTLFRSNKVVVDLSRVEQRIESSAVTLAAGLALIWAISDNNISQRLNNETVSSIAKYLDDNTDLLKLSLQPWCPELPVLFKPRYYDIVAIMNRLPGARFNPVTRDAALTAADISEKSLSGTPSADNYSI